MIICYIIMNSLGYLLVNNDKFNFVKILGGLWFVLYIVKKYIPKKIIKKIMKGGGEGNVSTTNHETINNNPNNNPKTTNTANPNDVNIKINNNPNPDSNSTKIDFISKFSDFVLKFLDYIHKAMYKLPVGVISGLNSSLKSSSPSKYEIFTGNLKNIAKTDEDEDENYNIAQHFEEKFFKDKKTKVPFAIITLISLAIGLTTSIYLTLLLIIISIFTFIVFYNRQGKIDIDLHSIRTFYIFFIGFMIFCFFNWIFIGSYYDDLLKKNAYDSTFTKYQDMNGYDFKNSEFMNYLVNYSDDDKSIEGKFEFFRIIKETVFNEDTDYMVGNGDSIFAMSGLDQSDIMDSLKSTDVVEINGYLKNFKIVIDNNNNSIIEYDGNDRGRINIQNVIDSKYGRNLSSDEIIHHVAIAIHLNYYFNQVSQRKNEFENIYNKLKFVRWIMFYPFQAFYYTTTVSSTIGFGDIYPVGLLPKISFVLFVLFVLIFLVYNVFLPNEMS